MIRKVAAAVPERAFSRIALEQWLADAPSRSR